MGKFKLLLIELSYSISYIEFIIYELLLLLLFVIIILILSSLSSLIEGNKDSIKGNYSNSVSFSS